MRDYIEEIYQSIRRNKLRTALTGFAVAWGIFMLIVLLGFGNGLLNSFKEDMDASTSNVINVYPGSTSKPYRGLPKEREIKLHEEDIALSQQSFSKKLYNGSPMLEQSSRNISYGKESMGQSIYGVYPSFRETKKIKMLKGRFINDKDLSEKRRAVVISNRMAEIFFLHAEPLQKDVKIDSLLYQVVGVYEEDRAFGGETYMPYTTMKEVYVMGKEVSELTFNTQGLRTQADCDRFEKEYRASFSYRKKFNSEDTRSIWIFNHLSNYLQQQEGASILTKAIWVIGLLTLLSGIVGVSNIMFITVRERKHEFGIRKALGAKPRSILWLIVSESVVITSIFGYIGMFFGVLATEYMNSVSGARVADVGAFSFTYFKNPTVDISIAIQAVITLVIAGVIAGIFPAWKAARTRPIEALRAKG